MNLLNLDPDRVAAYTVWLDAAGKWHARGHWYAFLTPAMVYHDAQVVSGWPGVVSAFAVGGSSRYKAIKKARAMLGASLAGGFNVISRCQEQTRLGNNALESPGAAQFPILGPARPQITR